MILVIDSNQDHFPGSLLLNSRLDEITLPLLCNLFHLTISKNVETRIFGGSQIYLRSFTWLPVVLAQIFCELLSHLFDLILFDKKLDIAWKFLIHICSSSLAKCFVPSHQCYS
uniref:Uncharacterized protein n=1 Tax=Rhizophora mucronata TaxID=61149 RepID=A0A2P2QBZ0_RHIMU